MQRLIDCIKIKDLLCNTTYDSDWKNKVKTQSYPTNRKGKVQMQSSSAESKNTSILKFFFCCYGLPASLPVHQLQPMSFSWRGRGPFMIKELQSKTIDITASTLNFKSWKCVAGTEQPECVPPCSELIKVLQ